MVLTGKLAPSLEECLDVKPLYRTSNAQDLFGLWRRVAATELEPASADAQAARPATRASATSTAYGKAIKQKLTEAGN